jgi:DNA ligase-1
MLLPTLYSLASTGATEQWTIEIDHKNGRFRTHHGQVGGKIVTTKWFEVEATNVGRSNERDVGEQAEFAARAKWKKKIESGATEDPNKVHASVTFIEPMLAKKWEDRADKVSYPIFCQPKYDGMRAVVTKDGATSRGGKPWKTIPHILAALKPIFELYPDLILDGELYNHELHDDFNKISSLAKKTKPSPADLKEAAEKLHFYWYDIADATMPFSKRTAEITLMYERYLRQDSGAVHPSIKIVPTFRAENLGELDEYYGKFMADGYEGQMVRLDETYEFKRSAFLLKRKEFTDDEYQIVEICEGSGNKSGMAGYAILKREDGVKFRSNIKGNHDFLAELLVKAPELVGKFATCKYFNLTPDGIPRFPYVIKIRDGKGID